MLIPAETLQKLIDRAAAQQRLNDEITRARFAGDEHYARFLEAPEGVQQRMLREQDIGDAGHAIVRDDVPAAEAAIGRAISRHVAPPPRREAPKPRRRRII